MGEIDLRRDAQQVHPARRKIVGIGIVIWTAACVLVSYFASLSIFAIPMLIALAAPPCTALAISAYIRVRKPNRLGLSGHLEHEGVFKIANTENPANIADVVFVHGLTGGAYETWSYRKEGQGGYFFWPKALGEDLPQCGIWSLSYAAGVSNWFGASGMAIQDRARNLVLKLLNAGIGNRPIVFVAHSMGGLEIKEIIVRSQTRGTEDWKGLVDAIKAIVFCGTPHRGAHIATAVKALSLFIRTQEHVQQMEMGSSGLDTLHDEFLVWQARTKVAIESYVEKNGLYRDRKWGNPSPLGLVVSLESGNPQIVGSDCFPIAADHIQLVKPTSRESDIYGGVLRFVRKALKLEAPATPPAPGAPTFPSVVAAGSTSPPANASDIRRPPELREGHIVRSILTSKEFELRYGRVVDVSNGPELVGVKYPNYEDVHYYDPLTLELEDEQIRPLVEAKDPHPPLVVINTKSWFGAITLHEGPTFLCADVSWWRELP